MAQGGRWEELGGPCQGEPALQCSAEGWRGGIGVVPDKAPNPVVKTFYELVHGQMQQCLAQNSDIALEPWQRPQS